MMCFLGTAMISYTGVTCRQGACFTSFLSCSEASFPRISFHF